MVKPVVRNPQAPHTRGASLVVFALVLLIVLGVLTWIAARQYEWSDARLLSIELALVIAVFALIGGFVLSERGTRDALQGAGFSGQSELGTGSASAGAVTLKDLARTLYLRHGPLWRYRESWLLLVGNAHAVAAHIPELATQDWHVRGETVLLHCPVDQNGLPDRTWLRRLACMRWR